MICHALELVGSSVELGLSLDKLLSINVPWSQEFSLVLVLDLSLLPLVFSLILTVASRLLQPYCINDKTSRLMEKRFHSE